MSVGSAAVRLTGRRRDGPERSAGHDAPPRDAIVGKPSPSVKRDPERRAERGAVRTESVGRGLEGKGRSRLHTPGRAAGDRSEGLARRAAGGLSRLACEPQGDGRPVPLGSTSGVGLLRSLPWRRD